MEQVTEGAAILPVPVSPFHMEHPHCGIIHTSREQERVNILVTPKGRLRERLDGEGRRLTWFVQKPEQLGVLRAWLQDIQLVANLWILPESPCLGYIDMDPYRRSLLLAKLVEPGLFARLQAERPHPWLDCRAEAKRIQAEALALALATGLLRCMEGEWYRGTEKVPNPALDKVGTA